MRRWWVRAILLVLVAASPCVAQTPAESNLKVWGDTLRYGTDTEVLAVVGSLREAKERTLIAELVGLLTQSRNEGVRVAILAYLEEIQDPAGRDAALAILALREEAGVTLLRATMTYLGDLHADAAEADLLALAESADPTVGPAAVSALARIGATTSVERLLALYDESDTPLAVRQQIALTLGDLGSPASLDLLRRVAADREADRVSRMYAAASLGKLGDTDSVDLLTALLGQEDALLRAYAAAALGRLKAPGVAETLVQILRDSSWQVRLEAARAIADGAAEGSVTDDVVGMLMYRARRDEVAQVRKESIRALGGIDRAECRDLLKELYEQPSQPLDIRAAALAELLVVDLPGSMASIQRVVEAEWSARTQKALELTSSRLAETESPLLTDLLGRFLESGNIAVKVAGIRGVALNGLRQYEDTLRQIAQTTSASVRREALGALEKLGLDAGGPTVP